MNLVIAVKSLVVNTTIVVTFHTIIFVLTLSGMNVKSMNAMSFTKDSKTVKPSRGFKLH
jgi:hypothetical protein